MGRGLGIFPARPKTHFVPGGATTRDKRPFCPGSWIHPGQKAPPFVPGGSTTRDKMPFCLGWWIHPGQKGSRGGGAELSVRAARSSGRRRRGGSTAQKWLSVGKGGEGKKYMGEGLLSRVEPRPGTKGIFGRAGKIPRPLPIFNPGWIYHPGQKEPVFPHSRQILCLFLFLFYFSFEIGFHLLIQLIKL